MIKKKLSKYISITHRITAHFYQERMSTLGLSRSHHGVLFNLYKHEGISQDALSKIMSVDKATVTRSIRKLMDAGFIRREQDENDKRSYLIYLTEKAHSIKPDIQDMINEWNHIILEGFTEEEEQQVMDYMERICANVRKYHDACHHDGCRALKEEPHERTQPDAWK